MTDLEKAKEAVAIRNEWCGWGNVNWSYVKI